MPIRSADAPADCFVLIDTDHCDELAIALTGLAAALHLRAQAEGPSIRWNGLRAVADDTGALGAQIRTCARGPDQLRTPTRPDCPAVARMACEQVGSPRQDPIELPALQVHD
jgi:hypothetical protein